MPQAFQTRAEAGGAVVETVAGLWPDVGAQVTLADVVVCHHVAYNIADVVPFVLALTSHARNRVVLELTTEHPLHRFNDLWLHFHALRRPERPTIDDALAVLREAGIEPRWESWLAPPGPWFGRHDDLVAWVRARVCLTEEHDGELAAVLDATVVRGNDGRIGFPGLPVVTVWRDGGRTSV